MALLPKSCLRLEMHRVILNAVQTICVYCGSTEGVNPAFSDAANQVGNLLAKSGKTLVYGGGNVGLMGILANSALRAGGRVVGVIPRAMVDREWAHRGLTELLIVRSMHERKSKMAELADGFIALPGGIGTLEELFEIWTWSQLGIHNKPIALLNVDGFYDPLVSFLNQLVREQFIRQVNRRMLLVSASTNTLLSEMESFVPPEVPKWISAAES